MTSPARPEVAAGLASRPGRPTPRPRHARRRSMSSRHPCDPAGFVIERRRPTGAGIGPGPLEDQRQWSETLRTSVRGLAPPTLHHAPRTQRLATPDATDRSARDSRRAVRVVVAGRGPLQLKLRRRFAAAVLEPFQIIPRNWIVHRRRRSGRQEVRHRFLVTPNFPIRHGSIVQCTFREFIHSGVGRARRSVSTSTARGQSSSGPSATRTSG